MKQTLWGLWNDYLLDECGKLETDEEKKLTGAVCDLHEAASALLSKEQAEAVDAYVEALCELEALFARKAFCKGCEFAVSFLREAAAREK